MTAAEPAHVLVEDQALVDEPAPGESPLKRRPAAELLAELAERRRPGPWPVHAAW